MQKVVAQKVDLSEADVESRLQTLVSLLPDIPARLPSMKPEIVARLLNDRQAVAHRLLSLKQIFPGAGAVLPSRHVLRKPPEAVMLLIN